MIGLATEEGLGDEEREVGVLVTCFLEHIIQLALHLLPDGVAVRFDHHAAAHGGVLRQIGFDYQVEVPLRIVFTTGRKLLQFFSHYRENSIALDYFSLRQSSNKFDFAHLA